MSLSAELSNSILPITGSVTLLASSQGISETSRETITIITTLNLCNHDTSGTTSRTTIDPPSPALPSPVSVGTASIDSSSPGISRLSVLAPSPSDSQSLTMSTRFRSLPAPPQPASSSLPSPSQLSTMAINSFTSPSPPPPSSASSPLSSEKPTLQSSATTVHTGFTGSPSSTPSSYVPLRSSTPISPSKEEPPKTTLSTATQMFTASAPPTSYKGSSSISSQTATSLSSPPRPLSTPHTTPEQGSISQSPSEPPIQSVHSDTSRLPPSSTPITTPTSLSPLPLPLPSQSPSQSPSPSQNDCSSSGNECVAVTIINTSITVTETAAPTTDIETVTVPLPKSSVPAQEVSISQSDSSSYSNIDSIFASLSSHTQQASMIGIHSLTSMSPPSPSSFLPQTTGSDSNPVSLLKSLLNSTTQPLQSQLPIHSASNFTHSRTVPIRGLQRQQRDSMNKLDYSRNHNHKPSTLEPTTRYRNPSLPLLAALLLALLLILLTRHQANRMRAIRQREWLRRRLERQRRNGLARI